jgi:hypothetical protein
MPPILPMDITVKPTGFMCPMHPVQILSYVVFFFDGYCFYFISIAIWSESTALSWSFAVPYTILFILVIVFAVIVTLSDPTDPTVYKERLMQLNGLLLTLTL